MSEGKFSEIQWTWHSSADRLRCGRVYSNRISGGEEVTLTELIEHLTKVAPGVKVDEVTVAFNCVKWLRPATPEEVAEREAGDKVRAARHEEWERRTLARLLEKYGPEPFADEKV